MNQTRERILDALQVTVAESGPSAATLEAVAARAGVSKGGLLYHFGTKEALYGGLLDRLRIRAEGNTSSWEDGGGDVVAGYLTSCTDAAGDFSATLLAVLRLVGTPGVDVEGAVVASFRTWAGALNRHIDDPVLAGLIALVGDGLYLHSLVGDGADDVDLAVVQRLVTMAREHESRT